MTKDTLWCVCCFRCDSNGTRDCSPKDCSLYRYFSGVDSEEWVEIPLVEVV